MAASGVQDLGAGSDIESYLLRVTGEGGAEIRRVLFFRYPDSAFGSRPHFSGSRAAPVHWRVIKLTRRS